jgi:hypothetical protein
MKKTLGADQQVTTADIARDDPMAEAWPKDGPAPRDSKTAYEQPFAALFPAEEIQELRSRWDSIQTRFVDEPRQSVQEADALVAGTIKRLADIFAQERSKLEGQWDRGANVSTEELRLGLQRYRSFFTRLLSV